VEQAEQNYSPCTVLRLGRFCEQLALAVCITPRLFFRWARSLLSLLHSQPQQIFNLPVDAAQFILRPRLEIRPKRRINPQQKSRLLVVKRAGVDDRMHLGFAA